MGFVEMGHHYLDIRNQQVLDPTICPELAKSAHEQGGENKEADTK